MNYFGMLSTPVVHVNSGTYIMLEYYYSFSSSAIVKKMVKNEDTDALTMTTLGRLKDGQCFGVSLIYTECID